MLDPIILGEQLITEFLTKIQQDLIAYLQTENRNASGKSAASLQVSASQTKGQLTGAPYIEFVFRGRGPGKLPPIDAIIDWVNYRGLPRGMAWAIARKIAHFGTKLWQQGRNVLNEIVTQQRIAEFTDALLRTYVSEFKSQIKTLLAA